MLIVRYPSEIRIEIRNYDVIGGSGTFQKEFEAKIDLDLPHMPANGMTLYFRDDLKVHVHHVGMNVESGMIHVRGHVDYPKTYHKDKVNFKNEKKRYKDTGWDVYRVRNK